MTGNTVERQRSTMRLQNELTDAAALRELGARIGHQRLERDLTQAELAREAGVDRTALQRLEGEDP